MKNFKEYINEIFENPNKIEWIVKTTNFWSGEFDINGKQYVIKAMKNPDMYWEVKFQLMLNNKPTEKMTGTGMRFWYFLQ